MPPVELGDLVGGQPADRSQGVEHLGRERPPLGGEEVERAQNLGVLQNRHGHARPNPGPTRNGCPAAIRQLAQILRMEQLAIMPGPPVEPLTLHKLSGAGHPPELGTNIARLHREDQRISFLIQRPVRPVGHAKPGPDDFERGLDNLLDRIGPDNGVHRFDKGLIKGPRVLV